jgi:hypothetical protein
MEFIIKIATPVGIFLTFFATIASIYYTRKNLKTTKYIETITSERIKWLEIIRNEVSDIAANIYFTLNIYEERINERIDDIIQLQGNDDDLKYKEQSVFFDVKTNIAFGKENKCWSQIDYVKYLHIFKVRLKISENKGIIETVNYFISFYALNKYKSEEEIPIAKEKINTLLEQVQMLLEDEWKKIKKESKGKI